MGGDSAGLSVAGGGRGVTQTASVVFTGQRSDPWWVRTIPGGPGGGAPGPLVFCQGFVRVSYLGHLRRVPSPLRNGADIQDGRDRECGKGCFLSPSYYS